LFKRFSSDYKKKEIELDLDDDYYDITPERLSMFLPGYSLTGLKNELYNRFINIQNAWMNFDYDALRELCTDELFNTYKSQLQVLKAKNGKNVMNGFFPKKINIYDVRASDGIISVKVYLKVSFFDYVVNTTSKKVTQGKRFKRITNHYEMVFVKSVMDNTVTRCPNCNASINFVTSGECPYCGSTIVVPPNQLVLSKKTNLLTK
jgi:DNA-directed RNA polymerase subunit RPC12/RpoP